MTAGKKPSKRVNIKAILKDPEKRRVLLARCLVSAQAMEGRDISYYDALKVVDRVAAEKLSPELAARRAKYDRQ